MIVIARDAWAFCEVIIVEGISSREVIWLIVVVYFWNVIVY